MNEVTRINQATKSMKFPLEGFLEEHKQQLRNNSPEENESNREIERLMAAGKLQAAYDVYDRAGFADEPLDFDEFVNSHMTDESNLD